MNLMDMINISTANQAIYPRTRPDSATETGYHKYIIGVLRATILYSISVYLTCQKYDWRTCAGCESGLSSHGMT